MAKTPSGRSVAHHPGGRIGRYVLGRRLGRGGTSEVWEAVLHGPRGFRKTVALKLLRPSLGAFDQGLVEEAKLGALLHHPNLVAVHELLAFDDLFAVAMELVVGASSDYVAAMVPWTGRAIRELALQACSALDAVHRAEFDGRSGFVHRDVKPANLMIDTSGLAKLTDLGIAAAIGKTQDLSGTPGYMAPEQLTGRASPRSDLFALGVTLYRLVVGTLPFGRVSDPDALGELARQCLGRPDFLSPLDELLVGLGPVVRRCLEPDQSERFTDAQSLQRAFAALPSHRDDLGLPELLHRVRPDLNITVGPRVALDFSSGNLGPARNRFIGREALVESLGERVVASRAGTLVTLVGLGGMGKTRLACEVGRQFARHFPGGVWMADLSSATTVAGACAAIGATFGAFPDDADLTGSVGRLIGRLGRCFIILDNLEQLRPHAALFDEVTAHAPEAAWLCTSRVPLDLASAQVVALGPLELDASCTLFVDRAGLNEVGIDRGELEALVAEVDGMPLAIELLSARAARLPLSVLRRQVAERLRLLAGGTPDRPPRHRSVRAALEGSWDLLRPTTQQALTQLTAFEGGWTLEAAAAVVQLPEGGWVLDHHAELAAAGLLYVLPNGRFTMPILVRELATQRLAKDEALVRHGRHFATLGAPSRLADLDLRAGAGLRARMALELDNFFVAARRAIARGDVEVARAAAAAAWAVVETTGPYGPVAELLDDVYHLVPWLETGLQLLEATRLAGRTVHAESLLEQLTTKFGRCPSLQREAGMLASIRGRLEEARNSLQEALQRYRAQGELHDAAITLDALGRVWALGGSIPEAEACFTEALAIHRDGGNARLEAVMSFKLGTTLRLRGQPAEARVLLGQSIRLLREFGDHRNLALAMGALALLHRHQGRLQYARDCFAEALALYRTLGRPRAEAGVHNNLGNLETDRGHFDAARESYEAALRLHHDTGDLRSRAIVLCNLGRLYTVQGELELARGYLERAIRDGLTAEDPCSAATSRGFLGDVLLRLGRLDEARESFRHALAVHQGLDREEQAHWLGRLAVTHRHMPQRATALLLRAEALLDGESSPALRVMMAISKAEVFVALGERERAKAALECASRLSPAGHASLRLEVNRIAQSNGFHV